ncbi:Pre-mRNA-splicing helicase BRR2 [Sporothrix epigloea]|uniref:Pre-mRNA-splicing helicase BRR2 n=1 Tax=Sporothrix epigloea TaxID=1892477 RepID=A0ABP0DD97_9PEZI
MADTITEPAVPSLPAKPDVLPYVEPAAASDAQEPNVKPDTPSGETSTPVGSDTKIVPANSARDAVGAAPALTSKEERSNELAASEAGQERAGTPSADTKDQAVELLAEEQPDKATTEIDITMAEVATENKAPASPVADEAPTSNDTAGDAMKTDEKEIADGASSKTEPVAGETVGDAVDAPAVAVGSDVNTPTKAAKAPTTLARRKSVGQKLNRKGSKARMVHLDAKPGEHYFVKLKGYPAWPVVICDEEMLPESLLKSRPVTAARPDGSYREDYADGGRRAVDRTFPVLYLYTYEFGWVPNQDMSDLDPEKVVDAINDKMRKDLQQAHHLAAENNSLDFYKELLRQFQADKEEAEEAKRQAAEAKRLAQATPKKSKKAAVDEDADMMDVPDDEDVTASTTKSKKRKAEEDVRTPKTTDSAKKPKIKITSSGTPKSSGTPSSATKNKTGKSPADTKVKNASKVQPSDNADSTASAEPELDPEEKRRRKAKEVLFFLRHKIQKGLLARDQAPKETEMKTVSEYLTKLEGLADLELSAIRETKMNKVLKAILKIETIPREDEFKFKPRSQTLLEKWNKLLAPTSAVEAATPTANGASTTTGEGKSNGLGKVADGAEKTAEVEKSVEEEKSEEVEKPEENEKLAEAEKSEQTAVPEPAAANDEPKTEEIVASA